MATEQMLAIARALMSRPRLLLDEPSLSLAQLIVRDIFAIIAELNAEGVTILRVEQNARLVMQHAHRTYVLEAGVNAPCTRAPPECSSHRQLH